MTTTPEQAALTLAVAALRVLTWCEHGEAEPGTGPDCEPLPPLIHLALTGVPLLCPTAATNNPAALRAALDLVEATARGDGRGDLAQLVEVERGRLECDQGKQGR